MLKDRKQRGITVHKDHTLQSNTKYAVAFSKTKRFPTTNPICPEAFYSFDTHLSNRNTTLGSGQKVDFAKLLPNAPAANRYRIKSSFQETKGKSFGMGRQKSPDRSYLIPQIHNNPGVGHYENQVQTKMTQKSSLHTKTIDVVQKSKTSNYTPGPGTYETLDFQKGIGKCSISKYTDSKLAKIDPFFQRFPSIKQSPGPSSYHNEDGMRGTGHYTLSKHTGKGGTVFSRQMRFTGEQWRPSENPGPSNYKVPTEFGQQIAAIHYQV